MEMTPSIKEGILKDINMLASRGLRILGMSYKDKETLG